jgi:spore coat protein CotH
MSIPASFRAPGLVFSLVAVLYWPIFRVVPRVQPVETSAELFDGTVLRDVRLYIHPRDLQRLRATYLENTYYPADFILGNTRVRNVAVRSRGGLATRDSMKPALRVDINRYTAGQTFAGLHAIVLDNLFQDKAMLREVLAMSVFARLGHPAPRESFCRLFVNNVYHGVYAIVEDIDEPFLARTFGRDDGYLFEYQWQQPYYGDPLGADFGIYRTLFEAKTHERAGDDELYGPVRALLDLVNAPAETTSREDLARYLDLEQLVTMLAIETLLGEEDAFAGLHGMNNFYLYREPGSTRHSFLPWDRDRAINLVDSSIFDRVNENALAQRALSYGDLRDRYLRVLEDGARLLLNGEWLAAEINRLHALIGPAALADPRKPQTNDEFEAAVEFLREWAARRPAHVLEEVAAYRGANGVSRSQQH